MWFNLDLCGITLKMRIKDYQPTNKESWDEQWCSVDYSLISEHWLNYSQDDDEVFLSCEIEELAQSLDDLLNDKITEVKTIKCIEPDFNFILVPKRDLRNDKRYTYVKEGYEIADIYMEMKKFFWNGGLTDNFLSISFGRKEIEYLRDYLLCVMKKIDKNNPKVLEMLKREILIGRNV